MYILYILILCIELQLSTIIYTVLWMSTVLVHLSFWPTLYYLVFLWRCNERESNSMPLFNISLIPILLQGFSKTKFCENFVILGKNEDYYEMRFLSCFCSVKNLTPIQRRHIIFNHPRCTVCVCAYDVASLAKISSNNSCKNFRNSRLVRCSWIQLVCKHDIFES